MIKNIGVVDLSPAFSENAMFGSFFIENLKCTVKT